MTTDLYSKTTCWKSLQINTCSRISSSVLIPNTGFIINLLLRWWLIKIFYFGRFCHWQRHLNIIRWHFKNERYFRLGPPKLRIRIAIHQAVMFSDKITLQNSQELFDIKPDLSLSYLKLSPQPFSYLRFSNRSPTVDAGAANLESESFCGHGVFKINIQFRCHLCHSSSVIFRNNTMISFCRRSFSLIISLSTCCLPIIRICWHNLRNCHSRYLIMWNLMLKFLSQMLQLNTHNRTKSLSYSHSTQSLMRRHEYYTV
jgi:hypothetical protein